MTFKGMPVEELQSFPNTSGREITAVYISTSGWDKPRVTVWLKDTSRFAPITFEVEDDDERTVIALSDKLGRWANDLRQWYSPFAHRTSGDTVGLSTLIGLLLISAAIFFPLARLIGPHPSDVGWVWGAALGIFSVIVSAMLVTKVQWALFPVGSFAIGEGIRRHDRTVKLRGLWGSVLGVAILIGLVVNIVANKISK
jgi:hypothetical protein